MTGQPELPLRKISDWEWEIPKHDKMNVPARIFASDKLIEAIKQDKTLQQAKNVASLPGILKAAYVMPDAHQGYGFPIGGVAAFDKQEGIISPGGVGYDINCGVRLLRTDYTADQIAADKHRILKGLLREVPAGVGRKSQLDINKDQLLDILSKGARWAVEQGYGSADDLKKMEEYGNMTSADPSFVSDKALKRGLPQLGTLGSGNHFLEIQKVDKIFDEQAAKTFGINKPGQVTIMIHTGSRGFGHQVASDYIRKMEEKYGHEHLPDRELINAPLQSELGQQYYKAMSSAINYAFVNRQMIMHWVREVFKRLEGSSEGIDLIYGVCHNIAKYERHKIEGKMRDVCVHRKGATRAFGPGREEIPEAYRKIGQPVLIPGSMGTASYLLVGTKKAEEASFGSTCHGAGRVHSRKWALRNLNADRIKTELAKRDIDVVASSRRGVAEEAPQVYKDIDEVVKVSAGEGLAKPVARLVPLGVVKG